MEMWFKLEKCFTGFQISTCPAYPHQDDRMSGILIPSHNIVTS